MRCEITSLGVEILAGALQTNRSLTHLHLASVFRSCSATALGRALLSNQTLTHLDLSENNISDSEAELLGKTLRDQNNTLAYLLLHDNCISAKGRAKLELVNNKNCVIDLGREDGFSVNNWQSVLNSTSFEFENGDSTNCARISLF